MYVPPAFAVGEDEAWAMLAQARLGVLVTHGPEGLSATHLPFVLDPERRVLMGHLARSNPHTTADADSGEALVIFQGVDAYISPQFYATKPEDGRVVPTWNYEAVHVRGRLTRFSEPDRLREVVDRLSDRFEAGSPTPWFTAEAPAEYMARLIRGIVGVELAVTSLTGVRKLSQNQPERNRASVRHELERGGLSERAVAARMRELP